MTAAFAGLFDDAAVFPPGNSPVAEAVPAHHEHLAAWYAGLVGPLVFPATRLGELAEVLDGRPLALSVTAAGSAVPAMAAFELDGVTVAAVELVPGEEDPVATLTAELPPDVLGYVEVPRGAGRLAMLDALAGSRFRAKFRTGGVVPQAYPSEQELAEAIAAAVARRLPFKCTAGLHHGVRNTAGDLEQHGFCNVLAATAAAVRDAGVADLAAILAERDPAAISKMLIGAGGDTLTRARELFVSFGTCSVAEPVADLAAMRLIESGEG